MTKGTRDADKSSRKPPLLALAELAQGCYCIPLFLYQQQCYLLGEKEELFGVTPEPSLTTDTLHLVFASLS